MKKSILTLTLIATLFSCGDLQDHYVEKQIENSLNKIANDAIDKYNMAKSAGNDMDAYVQAGMAATAFLEAQDEENYKEWKRIEKEEGQALGMEASN